MIKVIFLLHRRDGISREQFLREWSGDQHKSIASKVPGLLKVVQNHPVAEPSDNEPPIDGIGELWFASPETMQAAFDSTEWTAAIKDAERYADFARSQSLIVKELELFETRLA